MKQIDKVLNNIGDLTSFCDFRDEYFTYHRAGWTNYFTAARNNIRALAANYNGAHNQFIQDLVNRFESVIKATPTEIPALITFFGTGAYADLLYLNGGKTPFGRVIEEAFNYRAFRTSAKASWLAQRFDFKSCLYCNAQFTLVVGKEGVRKKLMFQFDHFFNKAKFPFLSLTLGNLIPSCSTCNSSKTGKPFDLVSHIHPYLEEANTKFEFVVDPYKALSYLLGNRDYKLLTPKINVKEVKIQKHIDDFNLDIIYEKHTDIVEELILKSQYYNESRRAELNKEFAKINLSKSTIDRFVLGNYSVDSEINKRPLAKLSQDIGKQFNLIK